MMAFGSFNVLSPVPLICGPRRDRPPGGSYRNRHEPPQVVDPAITIASADERYRPPSVPLARRMTGIGALQPVADHAAYGRRCPRLCENTQEPTRRRIIFSIALFLIAVTALFLFRLTKSRRTFYAQIECLCFHTGAPGDRQGVGGASPLR